MKQTLATVCAVSVTTFALMTGAHALWTVNDAVTIPAMQTGGVLFAAQASGDDGTRVVSAGGAAVAVTLPGSEIIKVLDQLGPDPDPVFWRFTASGTALGITGLTYDVAATTQVAKDGSTYDVSSGIAQEDTVLAGSTTKIYPAAAGGDCSTVPETPETPEGESPKNVYFYESQAHVLQNAGANLTGQEIEQEWCVAMDWNNDPDGLYVNDAQVSATAEDGSDNGALASWQAAVAFPPSLSALGEYYNKALVEAQAADLTMSRDEDDWGAVLYPDPSREPSLTLTLDPTITNLNPSVETGDTFQLVTTP
jgi:hypothetical protein